MTNEKIVVGLELQPMGTRDSYLILGIVAFFKTHTQRFNSVEDVAKVMAPWPIDPARIPAEEGWYRVGDLPKVLWQDLIAKIYDLRKRARLAEAKK